MRQLACACLVALGCSAAGTGGGGDDGVPIPDGAAAEVDAPVVVVDAAGVDAGGRSLPLRIATVNLLHGFPLFEQLEERTQIVVDWILAAQPDLIAIQEAAQTPTAINRGQIIADRIGYDWVWEKAAGVDFVFEEGPGILSRRPIVATAAAMLPHPGGLGFEVRKVVSAEIDTEAGRVTMVSGHLTTQSDPEVQADQALAAYDFLMAAPPGAARFFAGDMNADPDDLAMQFLRGEAVHAGRTGTLVDAWPAANPGQDGFTSSTPTPRHRIDYVYVSPEVQIVACEIVLDEPVGDLYASDHVGVMCDVVVGDATP